MELLYAIFFGAGVAGVAYARMGRRLGYSNTQNVYTVVGIVFFMATVFFYTILTTFIPN
jgi:hypothetical protein